MGVKMFSISDQNLDRLKRIDNMSGLINSLLNDYFENTKPIVDKLKEAELKFEQAKREIEEAKKEQEVREKNKELNEKEEGRLVIYTPILEEKDFERYRELLIKGEVNNIADFKKKFNIK